MQKQRGVEAVFVYTRQIDRAIEIFQLAIDRWRKVHPDKPVTRVR